MPPTPTPTPEDEVRAKKVSDKNNAEYATLGWDAEISPQQVAISTPADAATMDMLSRFGYSPSVLAGTSH